MARSVKPLRLWFAWSAKRKTKKTDSRGENLMGVCDIARIRKGVISALMANRLSPYAGTIPSPPTNSRYQDVAEFDDTILQVDAMVVHARISNPGDEYRPMFITATGNLANGDFVPGHIGANGNVDIDSGSGFKPARYTKSRAELIAVMAHPALYPDAEDWCFVEDSQIFHNGNAARVWRPTYTKTAACQSPDVDELAIKMGTLGSIPKDGAIQPEIYSAGANYFAAYLQMIKGEKVILPEVVAIERQLAA